MAKKRTIRPADIPIPPDAAMTSTPRWTIIAASVIGALLTLLAAATLTLAIAQALNPPVAQGVWWALLFQLPILAGSACCALLILNKFVSGPAITMASAGVCTGCSVALMEPSIAFTLLGRPGSDPTTLMSVPLDTIGIAQAALAAILCILATAAVYLRKSTATIPRAIIGSTLLAAPAIAYLTIGIPSLNFGSGAAGAAIRAIAFTAIGLLAITAVSIGFHLLARSISIGIAAGSPDPQARADAGLPIQPNTNQQPTTETADA